MKKWYQNFETILKEQNIQGAGVQERLENTKGIESLFK